jgi:predicted enzyme related to lactoylglutathione lyase
MAAEWNEDAEQYRVVLIGEHAATFTDIEAACDFYAEHACQFCWTHQSMHDGRCCDVQTWTRS